MHVEEDVSCGLPVLTDKLLPRVGHHDVVVGLPRPLGHAVHVTDVVSPSRAPSYVTDNACQFVGLHAIANRLVRCRVQSGRG